MKIIVGSKNPVKIKGTEEAFSKYYNNVSVEGTSVPGAPDQPFGDETLEGAKFRAKYLQEHEEADFYVGMEGGVAEHAGKWLCFAAVVVMDKQGRESFALSPHFPLPDSVAKRLLAGEELGPVMDDVRGETNTKQKDGACGFFTKGRYHRKDQYLSAAVMALSAWQHEALYFPS